ncbi:MAG: hypothetical protein ACREAU_01310 [Nitrosopumilaceae archaeon]
MNLNESKKDSARIIQKIRDRGRYICPDCSKSYAREATYIKHQCEPKRRKTEVQNTLAGRKALIYYQEWMKYRKVPTITPLENFLKSYFYRSFITFAIFAKQFCITNFLLFLHAMDMHGWLGLPGMWRSEDAYTAYIKYVDVQISPMNRVAATLEYLNNISEAANVDISDVFEVFEPGEIITLIEKRKLTLWFLLCCEKFYKYCDTLPQEQQEIINDIIESEKWDEKFVENPHLKEKFKKYAEEFGL